MFKFVVFLKTTLIHSLWLKYSNIRKTICTTNPVKIIHFFFLDHAMMIHYHVVDSVTLSKNGAMDYFKHVCRNVWYALRKC